MAKTFLTPLDLNKNELRNARVQNLAAPPTEPVAGQLYFDTAQGLMFWYDGADWKAATATSEYTPSFGLPTEETSFGQPSGAGIAVTLSRSDHTHGTPAHGDAEHAGISVSVLAAPTGNLDLAGFKITTLGEPTSPTDAATRAFVEAAVAAMVDSSPETLNTLRELATALGDDPNFATTVATQIGELDGRLDTLENQPAGAAKYAETIGDGTATSFVVTHNLGTRDISVSLYQAAAPFQEVEATVELTSTTAVTLRFSDAPAVSEYRVVCLG